MDRAPASSQLRCRRAGWQAAARSPVLVGVGSSQHVCTLVDRDRSFGVFAQRDARHAKRCRLFLHSSAIREDHSGVLPQVQKLHVTLRTHQSHAWAHVDSEFLHGGPGARVHRKDKRQPRRNLPKRDSDLGEHGFVIDIARPV
jgi:hypothetical protein